jgi:predicted nucleotidyltransferase
MPPRDVAGLYLQAPHWALLRDLLARHTPQAEAWAYGSRVDGSAHDTSDLDVVLRNPADLSQDPPGWDDLKEAIQNSRLPILVDLHLWSRLPQSFHANIEAAYVVLQTGDGPCPDTPPPERKWSMTTGGDEVDAP